MISTALSGFTWGSLDRQIISVCSAGASDIFSVEGFKWNNRAEECRRAEDCLEHLTKMFPNQSARALRGRARAKKHITFEFKSGTNFKFLYWYDRLKAVVKHGALQALMNRSLVVVLFDL